jgi:hypothetical protein
MPQGRYWNTMTKAQQRACKAQWLRFADTGESYLTFRRRFKANTLLGCYFGPTPAGFFLGIEKDGHCHT